MNITRIYTEVQKRIVSVSIENQFHSGGPFKLAWAGFFRVKYPQRSQIP